jgi:SAM-dependent methyltransferase
MRPDQAILNGHAYDSAYMSKPLRYFTGPRTAFIDELPDQPAAKLLEIGCAGGDTAACAKARGKCGWSVGVELCPGPAADAEQKMDRVIVGDVESLDLPFEPGTFDVLLLSEVLEHLRDPWAVLRKLHGLLKPGAQVIAGSPNVAHHSIIRMLLRGRWDYAEVGLMDVTHLRWFTPDTYRQLFEDCGYSVEAVGPASPLRRKAASFDWVTLGRLRHLLHSQIRLKAIRR